MTSSHFLMLAAVSILGTDEFSIKEDGSIILNIPDPDDRATMMSVAPDVMNKILIAAEVLESSAPPPAYRLYKSVFIARLDEGVNEPEIMEAALAAAPAKLRLLFNSVEYFVSDDPLFYDLYEAIASVLGPYRATQLLEPNREP